MKMVRQNGFNWMFEQINSVEFQRNFDTIECLRMKPKKPSFGTTLEIEQLAEALNLQANDFDPEFPIQEVGTGLPFLIIPVKSSQCPKKRTK